MPPISALQHVLDDGSFLVAERQHRLAELVGEDSPFGDRYHVDLAVGLVAFSGREGRLDATAHLVGSAAPGPGTWMWAWNNVNGFPDVVVARSAQVRALGERFAVPELREATVPLRRSPREDAHQYGLASSLVCGGSPYYTAEVGGGTVVTFLLDHPRFALGPPSALTASTLLPATLAEGGVVDARRAVLTYAQQRGFGCSEVAERVTLTAADGRVETAFDGQGRLVGLQARLGATD